MANSILLSRSPQHKTFSATANVYAPLNDAKTGIRVLELQPGQWHEELRGTLRIVSLKTNPLYEALSYTWGAQTQSGPREPSRGGRTLINDNLYYALRRLRWRAAVRTLWIDALCINQQNDDEKGHQVAIMGKIYRLATTVFVWLGEYPNAQAKDERDTLTPHWGRFSRLNSRGKKFAELLDSTLQHAQPKWHDRAWIVQEFVLARRAIFCFGPISFPFDKLYLQDLTERLPRQMDHLLAFFYRISDMVKLEIGIRNNGVQSIHDVVLYTSTASCKNPSDKVYSVLSLIDPKEASMMPVDYRLSPVQVFARATYAAIVVQRTFAILELIGFKNTSVHRQSSWTVDFTSEQDSMDGQLHIYLKQGIDWSAERYSIHQCVSLSADARYLTVTGYTLSKIGSVLPLPNASLNASGDTAVQFAAHLSSLLQSTFHHHYSTSAHIPDARSVLTKDNFLVGGSKTQILTIMNAALAIWEGLTNPSSQRTPYWQLSRNQKYAQETSAAGGEPGFVLSYAKFVSGGAMVFALSGGLIGVAPATVEPGDRVVLVIGSRLPVVLRRAAGGYWVFRGFVWVHGLVGGGFMEQIMRGRVGEERFLLC
ncbi:uncharacterized protein LTR77_004770 [Saxophila tyrrhenica]|uniref:Heterokaryon incompatibility domain-containing protein n=1 Tax=Saxophila tyrrhenica TaxID=1690608 RepID=A0AAV9PAQ8_9PEZI|nr:hypothetical protein LTR77_004770 [Saxophila tyrrhenica]